MTDTELMLGELRGYRAFLRDINGGVTSLFHDGRWNRRNSPPATCTRLRQQTQFHMGVPVRYQMAPFAPWPPPPEHSDADAPMWGCECGYYAYYRPDSDANTWLHQHGKFDVVGVVRARGKTIMHTRGFKARHVEIVALSPPRVPTEPQSGFRFVRPNEAWADSDVSTGDLLGGLDERYGVPVFTSFREMVEQFPPTTPELKGVTDVA